MGLISSDKKGHGLGEKRGGHHQVSWRADESRACGPHTWHETTEARLFCGTGSTQFVSHGQSLHSLRII